MRASNDPDIVLTQERAGALCGYTLYDLERGLDSATGLSTWVDVKWVVLVFLAISLFGPVLAMLFVVPIHMVVGLVREVVGWSPSWEVYTLLQVPLYAVCTFWWWGKIRALRASLRGHRNAERLSSSVLRMVLSVVPEGSHVERVDGRAIENVRPKILSASSWVASRDVGRGWKVRIAGGGAVLWEADGAGGWGLRWNHAEKGCTAHVETDVWERAVWGDDEAQRAGIRRVLASVRPVYDALRGVYGARFVRDAGASSGMFAVRVWSGEESEVYAPYRAVLERGLTLWRHGVGAQRRMVLEIACVFVLVCVAGAWFALGPSWDVHKPDNLLALMSAFGWVWWSGWGLVWAAVQGGVDRYTLYVALFEEGSQEVRLDGAELCIGGSRFLLDRPFTHRWARFEDERGAWLSVEVVQTQGEEVERASVVCRASDSAWWRSLPCLERRGVVVSAEAMDRWLGSVLESYGALHAEGSVWEVEVLQSARSGS